MRLPVEEAMETCHPDIVEGGDRIAEMFGCDPCLFGHRDIRGAGAENRNGSLGPCRIGPQGITAEHPGLLVVGEFWQYFQDPVAFFRINPGREKEGVLGQKGAGNTNDLIAAFSGSVDHFRSACAQGAMVVDTGVLDALTGQVAQLVQGLLNGGGPLLDRKEKFVYGILVHGLWENRKSVASHGPGEKKRGRSLEKTVASGFCCRRHPFRLILGFFRQRVTANPFALSIMITK